MDNNTRLQYLQAMGIEVWLPKDKPVMDTVVTTELTVPDHFSTLEPQLPVEPKENVGLFELDDVQPAKNLIPNQDNWPRLETDVANCSRCELCNTRKNTVFGSGNKAADWMVIGEAPGQSEDEQGLPFVGNAGLLLTEMLRAIGLERDEVFIANILKCRPPNNRDPKPEEAALCQEYLQRQFALIQPKIILAVGRIAAQTLLQTQAPVGQLRGKTHTFNHTPVIVVYHPSYLLRSPLEKRKAWADLQFALQTFNTINT